MIFPSVSKVAQNYVKQTGETRDLKQLRNGKEKRVKISEFLHTKPEQRLAGTESAKMGRSHSPCPGGDYAPGL